jgi:hypothetical protein
MQQCKQAGESDNPEEPRVVHKDVLACQFDDKLSSKVKLTQLNFISKNCFCLKKEQASRSLPRDAPTLERSLYNTRSVFLPALKNKQQGKQFRERLLINETIFIHERVPIRENRTIQAEQKWKANKYSTPFPMAGSPDRKKGRDNSRTRITLKSLKIVGDCDCDFLESNATEPLKHEDADSPSKLLSRHRSNEKLLKSEAEVYQHPVAEPPEAVLGASSQLSTVDPSVQELTRKKNAIEKMIVQYRLKRQKAEEKSISLRCLPS